jgi:hypothetical protein
MIFIEVGHAGCQRLLFVDVKVKYAGVPKCVSLDYDSLKNPCQ